MSRRYFKLTRCFCFSAAEEQRDRRTIPQKKTISRPSLTPDNLSFHYSEQAPRRCCGAKKEFLNYKYIYINIPGLYSSCPPSLPFFPPSLPHHHHLPLLPPKSHHDSFSLTGYDKKEQTTSFNLLKGKIIFFSSTETKRSLERSQRRERAKPRARVSKCVASVSCFDLHSLLSSVVVVVRVVLHRAKLNVTVERSEKTQQTPKM